MKPDISVVLPARDEAGNITTLLTSIAATLQDRAHEIIVIDDASRDGTRAELAALQTRLPHLREVCHDRSCGQSAAIRSGVWAARGALIERWMQTVRTRPTIFLPCWRPLPGAALRWAWSRASGWTAATARRPSRRLASIATNRIRNALLRDSGCGLKAFPRVVYLALPYFDHIHRFMPAMVARKGLRVQTVPVTHAPRAFGWSKYGNLRRAAVGVVDLLGMRLLFKPAAISPRLPLPRAT